MNSEEKPMARAKAAWEAVKAAANKDCKKDYGRLAKSVPADIQANGLGQTLAFLRAKGSKDGKPKPEDAHWLLQEDISSWVMARLGLPQHRKGLLGWITDQASTDDYRRATAEAMAFLVWLKRFAEAELGGE
jgi:CRISPR-associated protein Cmr5